MHSRNTVTASKGVAPQRQRAVVLAPGAPPRYPTWWVHGLVILALLGVCFALYGRTFGLGFLTLDDPDYIQNNPFIADLDGAKLSHILSTPYFANYAPGHLLSYALDVAIAGGKSARAMHLSNVLWYGWEVCMVYVLGLAICRYEPATDQTGLFKALRTRGQDKGDRRPSSPSTRSSSPAEESFMPSYQALALAAAAALLFAVHPAHVEVVAWLSSRKDLVATGFAVISMACYLCSRCSASASRWWYAGSVISFLLASSGKQSVLLLPLVMLAWDVFVDGRRTWRMLLEKIPFGLIALFFGWMTWGAQPSTGQSPEPFVLAMTQWSNLWLLTGLGQYVLYRPRPDPTLLALLPRLAIIASAMAVWAVPLLLARWQQMVRAALSAWVLIQMLPPMALSFLTPITDRYLFLPSVGVCLLVTRIQPRDTPKTRTWTASLGWIALAMVLVVWSWKTWDYVGQWRDPRSVWYFAAIKSPSPQAYQYSGEVYHDAADRLTEFLNSGKYPNQTNDLRLARAVLGDSPQVERLRVEWAGANSSRTNSLAYRDRLWTLAWEQYSQAVTCRGTLNVPTLFMRRGMILINQGRHEEAIKEFKIGLDLAQTHTYVKVRQEVGTGLERAIGVAYWGMGKYVEAKEWLLKAQATQRQSGQIWVPTLDQEVERISGLAQPSH